MSCLAAENREGTDMVGTGEGGEEGARVTDSKPGSKKEHGACDRN